MGTAASNGTLGSRFEIFDWETERTETVTGRPSAWLRAIDWLEKNQDAFPKAAQTALSYIVWGVFAAKGDGDPFSFPDDLDREAVESIMDRYSFTKVDFDDEGQEAPLAKQPKRN